MKNLATQIYDIFMVRSIVKRNTWPQQSTNFQLDKISIVMGHCIVVLVPTIFTEDNAETRVQKFLSNC